MVLSNNEMGSVEVLVEQKEKYTNLQTQLRMAQTQFGNKQELIEKCKKDVSVLSEVPCGGQYTDCKFIKNAQETS
jgi:hypothetical protein